MVVAITLCNNLNEGINGKIVRVNGSLAQKFGNLERISASLLRILITPSYSTGADDSCENTLPHLGHFDALSETKVPHSGHLTNIIQILGLFTVISILSERLWSLSPGLFSYQKMRLLASLTLQLIPHAPSKQASNYPLFRF